MSRRTAEQYVTDANNLRCIWLHHRGLFAEVSPRTQWLLHDYFRPAKDWTDQQRLAHRKAVTTSGSSLPQQAGRALREFIWMLHQPRLVPVAPYAKPAQPTIKGVVNPEIDIDKLARALLRLAKQQLADD